MKKLFGIEKKLINPMFTKCYNADLEYIGESKIKCWFNEWRLWRKYATEKQRDEAFKALSSNRFMWEYRKINL
jgi:hypothetical protein